MGFDPLVLRNIRYEEQALRPQPGDLLALYSDGVVEAPHAQDGDELFGDDRLAEVMTRHRTDTAGQVLEAICEEITAFQGGNGQSDDVTLVAIKAKD